MGRNSYRYPQQIQLAVPIYDEIEENRVKHLDMIQAVVGRLGTDSFLVKGWTVTVAGAFAGFAVNLSDAGLAGASLVTTFLFWTLDSQFLRSERLFRALFERVRNRDEGIEPFFMAATGSDFVELAEQTEQHQEAGSRWKTFWSNSLRTFYGAIVALTLILILLLSLGSEYDSKTNRSQGPNMPNEYLLLASLW